jgi:hypothetical protein
MSKLVNLFTDSDKLDGPKNYKTWSRHMKNTLIYNELWKDVFNGDKPPTNPIDDIELDIWELKDEKTLALLRSSVTNEMFVHIENVTNAWNTWKLFKNMFYTKPK